MLNIIVNMTLIVTLIYTCYFVKNILIDMKKFYFSEIDSLIKRAEKIEGMIIDIHDGFTHTFIDTPEKVEHFITKRIHELWMLVTCKNKEKI